MARLTVANHACWLLVSLALLANSTKATRCTVNKERDPATNRVRWWVQAAGADPCDCTEMGPGGLNVRAAHGPRAATYHRHNTVLVSSDPEEIRRWLNCPAACPVGGPLGMEDRRITDDQLTASTVFQAKQATHGPTRARPDTSGYAGAWCNGDSDTSPWIQVDFDDAVTVTGLVTLGRQEDYDQWVTAYRVEYTTHGDLSWHHVTDALSAPITFTGNSDANTPVTNPFPFALRTKILRIYPTAWNNHCSMRFEVIGCY